MKNKNLADFREDYRSNSLLETTALADPLLQFRAWLDRAIAAKIKEPNAMTLATATKEGIPSARIVLLKDLDEKGFVFYTNYQSRKGEELLQNPHAALVFCWLDLEQQIRVEGRIERLSEAASTAYFQSRPKASQIGAWASPQSQFIKDRTILEQKMTELTQKYAVTDSLPKPPHWGGYRLLPKCIEFWQGRSSRLHDRLLYERQGDQSWKIKRLAP